MIESSPQDPQFRARLQLCARDCALMRSTSAARWALRHVAFNNGFDTQAGLSPHWTWPAPTTGPDNRSGSYMLRVEMRDACFELRVDPEIRGVDLLASLGPAARHLRRNLPQLVEALASICGARVESMETLNGASRGVERRQQAVAAAEPLLPA